MSAELPQGLPPLVLTASEREQIADILKRRANDIASFQGDVKQWTGGTFKEFPGSVEMGLTREVKRLRRLADRVNPTTPEPDEEDEE